MLPDSEPDPVNSAVSAERPPALFLPDGEGYLPTRMTTGPWRPDAQHGGPPSALLGALTETLVNDAEFVAFIEVELTRPVPLSHLDVAVARERVSGRVSRVRAELLHVDKVVSRSSALVLATATDLPAPDTSDAEPPAVVPGPEATVMAPAWASGEDITAYHRDAVEHRFASGSFIKVGPAFNWIRLRQPVIAGQEPTGLQRVLAAADFGSGISAIYRGDGNVGLINANVAVTFERSPVGEWIGIDSTTRLGPQGTGTAVTTVSDANGRMAVATQSLLGLQL